MNKKLAAVSLLMVISALLMFFLGYFYKNWAPVVTGLGFLVTAWGFKVLRQK